MRISIDTKDLKRALTLTRPTLGKTMPILASVRIEVTPSGEFTLASTDLEVATCVTLKGSDPRPGATTVAHKTFAAIVRAHREPRVALALESATSLRVGAATLPAVSTEEYPTLPSVESPRVESFDSLCEVLEYVARAASKDETRYNLCGVHVAEDRAEGVTFTATDGHRLHRDRIGAHVWGEPCILPLLFVRQVIAACKADRSSAVTFYRDGARIEARVGSVSLWARLIDGENPNFAQVVPNKADCRRMDLDGPAFLAALETLIAVGGFARFEAIAGEWWVGRVNDPDGGRAEARVAFSDDAPEVPMGFNPRYLRDAVEGLGSTLAIYTAAEEPALKAVLITRPGIARFAVVMPMRF